MRSSRPESAAIASRPSATARRNHSAPSRTKVAGSKIVAATSCTRNNSGSGGTGVSPVHHSAGLTSTRTTMKSNRIALVLALFLTIWITPAYGVNKDLVELQTQVQQLQQQMTQMKQSFDEHMGV